MSRHTEGAGSSTSSSPSPIDRIPDDVLTLMLQYLARDHIRHLGAVRLVCSRFAQITDGRNGFFWEPLYTDLTAKAPLPDDLQAKLSRLDIYLPWQSIYRHARKLRKHKQFLSHSTGVLTRRRQAVRDEAETQRQRVEQEQQRDRLRRQQSTGDVNGADAEALMAIWNEFYAEMQHVNLTQQLERNRLSWKLYDRIIKKRLGMALETYMADFTQLRTEVMCCILEQLTAKPVHKQSSRERPMSGVSYQSTTDTSCSSPPPLLDEDDPALLTNIDLPHQSSLFDERHGAEGGDAINIAALSVSDHAVVNTASDPMMPRPESSLSSHSGTSVATSHTRHSHRHSSGTLTRPGSGMSHTSDNEPAESLALTVAQALAQTHRELMMELRSHMLMLTDQSVRDAWFGQLSAPDEEDAA